MNRTLTKMLVTSFVLALATASLWGAAGVTGTWSGSMQLKLADGRTVEREVYGELVQTGKTVTGSAGLSAIEKHDIQRGTIDRNNLTFQLTIPGDPVQVYRVKLTLVKPDRLDGTVETEAGAGQQSKGQLVLTRGK
jgi:hypothetical protein